MLLGDGSDFDALKFKVQEPKGLVKHLLLEKSLLVLWCSIDTRR